jgi:hypothetical protein
MVGVKVRIIRMIRVCRGYASEAASRNGRGVTSWSERGDARRYSVDLTTTKSGGCDRCRHAVDLSERGGGQQEPKKHEREWQSYKTRSRSSIQPLHGEIIL